MRTFLRLLTCLGLRAVGQAAPVVHIEISTDSRMLTNFGGIALSPGNLAVAGDGAAVQVGYYPGAVVGRNFGPDGLACYASFIPLVGYGAASGINLTVGDSPQNFPSAGEVFAELDLFAGTNGLIFPPIGTPLVLRLFSNATPGVSSGYEAVSNNLWLWRVPTELPNSPWIALDLDQAGLAVC